MKIVKSKNLDIAGTLFILNYSKCYFITQSLNHFLYILNVSHPPKIPILPGL